MPKAASAVAMEIAENLATQPSKAGYKIQIAGSVSLGATAMYLRLEGSRYGIKVTVDDGSFDNPLYDAENMTTADSRSAIILAPFLDTVVSEFESRISEFSPEAVSHVLEMFIQKWKQVIRCIPPCVRVVLLGLHSIYPAYPYGQNRISGTLSLFNSELRALAQLRPSLTFVDMEALVYSIGLHNAIDLRMYSRAKSPYSSKLAEMLAKVIVDALELDERVTKAIVLDCDNTLWGGILAEDGIQGVQIDQSSPTGSYYRLAQRAFKELRHLGVLICLASKNNEQDVLRVLDDHESQIIRREDVITYRINWASKSDSLLSISKELNIGLDSLLFVDDSLFECAEVASRLPEVRVLQFPAQLTEIPSFLADLKRICLAGRAELSSDKTLQYRTRGEIESDKSNSQSNESFLERLDVKVAVLIDDIRDVTRLGEMFRKTNQFNTTTLRRTPEEIKNLIEDEQTKVISFRVSDRYADHGLTACVVLQLYSTKVVVTDWLISCRVLGRRIESGILSYVAQFALQLGRDLVEVEYLPTSKNEIAHKFLHSLSPRVSHDGAVLTFESGALLSLRPSWIAIKS